MLHQRTVSVFTWPRLVEASKHKIDEADFVMIKEGRVYFEGTASELRTSQDPYLQTFLS